LGKDRKEENTYRRENMMASKSSPTREGEKKRGEQDREKEVFDSRSRKKGKNLKNTSQRTEWTRRKRGKKEFKTKNKIIYTTNGWEKGMTIGHQNQINNTNSGKKRKKKKRTSDTSYNGTVAAHREKQGEKKRKQMRIS